MKIHPDELRVTPGMFYIPDVARQSKRELTRSAYDLFETYCFKRNPVNGEVYLSNRDAAALMGYSPKTIPRLKAELIAKGWIHAEGDQVALVKGFTRIPSLEPRPPQERNKLPIPAELRWEIWERDNFTCQHCGSRRFLTVDHIRAESKGGTLEPSNLQTLCESCNKRKGAR